MMLPTDEIRRDPRVSGRRATLRPMRGNSLFSLFWPAGVGAYFGIAAAGLLALFSGAHLDGAFGAAVAGLFVGLLLGATTPGWLAPDLLGRRRGTVFAILGAISLPLALVDKGDGFFPVVLFGMVCGIIVYLSAPSTTAR